jgi:DNA-binding NarL/FixJ family response regulator
MVVMKWENKLTQIMAPLYARPEISVLEIQTDSYHALKLAETEQPDVLIVGHHLDYLPGLEFVSLIRNKCPGARIILISPYTDLGRARIALSQGVSGYLVWNSDMHILTSAVDMVFRGGLCVSPQVLIQAFNSLALHQDHEIASFMKARSPGETYPFFSGTEREILALIIQEKNTKEIAEDLGLKNGTVRNYISRIMQKTKSASRVQIFGFVLGLILDQRTPKKDRRA